MTDVVLMGLQMDLIANNLHSTGIFSVEFNVKYHPPVTIFSKKLKDDK